MYHQLPQCIMGKQLFSQSILGYHNYFIHFIKFVKPAVRLDRSELVVDEGIPHALKVISTWQLVQNME